MEPEEGDLAGRPETLRDRGSFRTASVTFFGAQMKEGHAYTLVDPGLQAEETKVPGPGAGLCPGFTISRAILADAIALTRGDRFYTQACKHFPYSCSSHSGSLTS